MKIEYTLKEEDFINYHLFSFLENKQTQKTYKISKLLIIALLIYISINIYNQGNKWFAAIPLVFIILIAIFYNKIYKSKLRKHYTNITRKNYANRIGEKETMEFTPEYIITEDKSGEGKTKLSEIEKIDETKNNFFIKLSNGSSFIVPKNGIKNIDHIKQKWTELNIPISENLSWEWK